MNGGRSAGARSLGAWVALVALAWISSSCAADERQLWLPSEGSASTLLLVANDKGEAIEVYAYDTPPSIAIQLPIGADGDRQLYAIRYSVPLRLVGVGQGRLELRQQGIAIPSSPLPLLSSAVVEGEPSPWRTIDALPAAVADLRLDGTSPCVGFTVEELQIPLPNEEIEIALALGPSKVLLATHRGHFFELGPSGLTPLTDLATTTPHRAAFFDEEAQEIWLGGNDGRIVRGDLERGFRAAATVTTGGSRISWLVGGPGAAGLELYAMTSSLGVARLDGDRWVELLAAQGVEAPRSRGRMAWTGPGQVVMVGTGTEDVLEIVDGVVTSVKIPLDYQIASEDALYSVADVPSLGGPLVGTRFGFVYVRRPDGWRRLPQQPTDGRVHVMLPLDRGMILGGQRGVFIEYFEGFGYCDPFAITHFDPYLMVPFGDGYVLTDQGLPAGSLAPVTMFQRLPGSPGS